MEADRNLRFADSQQQNLRFVELEIASLLQHIYVTEIQHLTERCMKYENLMSGMRLKE